MALRPNFLVLRPGLETYGLGLEAFGLVFLALASFKAKAKVKVTNILPNTVYHGIITLTVHCDNKMMGEFETAY